MITAISTSYIDILNWMMEQPLETVRTTKQVSKIGECDTQLPRPCFQSLRQTSILQLPCRENEYNVSFGN